MAQTNSDAIAVVTVHGTGDTADGLDGPKWFQRGSQFAERLKARLSAKGVNAEIVPHLWSGANSAWDREIGANKLAHLLKKIGKDYAAVHVVGHSHGGNVANDAAVLLKWGLKKPHNEDMDSLITVGTPFFNVKTGVLQTIAGLLFNIITWASVIMFPVAALMWIGTIVASQQWGMLPLWIGYLVLVGLSLMFMLRLSSQGVRRILRPRNGDKTRTTVFSIWHENDEAISFLQRVEELPLEPFPRGALFRGSRAAAISWSVLAVLAICVGIPVLHLLGFDLFGLSTQASESVDYAADATREAAQSVTNGGVSINNFMVATIIGLWFAPAIFVLIYYLYRYLVGGASEVGARGSLNNFIGGVLRGIAMGRDGDQILCQVSTKSHTHKTDEHKLSGELHERMQAAATVAAEKLIEKYRWALFTVGGDASASLTTLTSDAMTWDSLIHTTYFDQPEIADIIGDYIAARAKGDTGA